MLSWKEVAQIESISQTTLYSFVVMWLALTNRIWEEVIFVAAGPRLLRKEVWAHVCPLHTDPLLPVGCVWCWGLRKCGSWKSSWCLNDHGEGSHRQTSNAFLGSCARQTFTVSEHYTYGSLYHSRWVYTEKQNTPSLSQSSSRAEETVKDAPESVCIDSGTLVCEQTQQLNLQSHLNSLSLGSMCSSFLSR